ncbi:MAG: tetratricopeptide repeat protein, partial [Anaerolineales bacterium]
MGLEHEHIVQAVDVVLEVLGTFGVPGMPLARRAVQAVEKLRRDRVARQRLENCLRKAEEDFCTEARRQNLHDLADWVVMLPQQDRPLFRQALESLLRRWNEADLQDLLAKEFAGIPRLETWQKRRAVALYLDCLRNALLLDEHFRAIILALSTLRTETKVEEVLERLEALYRAITALRDLPRGLVTWPVIPPPEGSGLRAFLLQPKYRLVPYTGAAYQQTLQDLIAWAKDLENAEGKVGLRIYLGPGGSGKTRLLIEAGEALRREGWWVGFLSGSLDRSTAERLVSDPRPTLLILDYVGGDAQKVRTLLQALIPIATAHLSPQGDLPPRTAPLALILLERTMPEWLDKTLRIGEGLDHPHRWEFLHLPGVEWKAHPLPDLQADERHRLFEQAVQAFSERIQGEQPTISYPTQDLPERPLPLVLLALHAALGERLPNPKDEEAILEFTWEQREKAAWKRLLCSPLEKHGVAWAEEKALQEIEHVLLLATLGRPFPDVEALAAFLQAHFPPIRGPVGQTLDWGWLAEQFPYLFPEWREGPLPPIVSDPLADFVLRRRLKADRQLLELALPSREEMESDPDGAAEMVWKAFGVLARVCESAPREDQSPAWEWLEASSKCLAKRIQGVEQMLRPFLEAIDRRLLTAEQGEAWQIEPVRRMTHWSLAAAIWSALLKALAPEEKLERARLWNSLGYVLSASGRREEALQATQEAAAIYRQLAQVNPQAFLPDLAMSLNNLGNRLSALGRREEALQAAQEATALYRQLAQVNPQAFLPDLAMSLNNLGNRLSALGRREEALQAAQEATALYRQLAQAHPQAFLPDLAMSLNNLGNVLSELGRREEALQAAQEAVEIRRQLAQVNPQAFLPDLAMSLNNLGARLFELGRREEALQATQEATTLYRQLAQAHPQAFLPDLATSLNTLGALLSELGRREEALQATQEAAAIYRQLAQVNPQAFLPDLAMSLNNLGNVLSELGRREEALQAAQEATALYRQLAQVNPQAFLPDLAMSLNN